MFSENRFFKTSVRHVFNGGPPGVMVGVMMGVILGFTLWLSSAASQAQVAVAGKEATRAQALKALDQPSAQARLAAVVRLAEVGTMLDADRVALRLHDDDAQVRRVASASLWQIWSRSGSKAIDSQYQRGVKLMEAGQLKEAVSAFSDIIKKQPTFAEAWNKRATLLYMMGEYQLSLKDCDEVLKRNRHHFGALSGYAQIYTELGDFKRALGYFEQALKVNPSLPNAASTLQFLQDKLAQKERNTV